MIKQKTPYTVKQMSLEEVSKIRLKLSDLPSPPIYKETKEDLIVNPEYIEFCETKGYI